MVSEVVLKNFIRIKTLKKIKKLIKKDLTSRVDYDII